WSPTDDNGQPLPAAKVPLMIAVAEHRPAHGGFWISGLDGTRRHIHATAIPLMRSADPILGAGVILWAAPPRRGVSGARAGRSRHRGRTPRATAAIPPASKCAATTAP